MALATNGVTSMSTRPIQIITLLGFLVSLFSFAMIIYCIIDWFSGRNVPGYTTSLVVSLLMGGLTIFSWELLVNISERYIWRQKLVPVILLNLLYGRKRMRLGRRKRGG